MEEKTFKYDVKCRKCGNIQRMWFGYGRTISKEDFKTWVIEHSTFPVQLQCDCDRGMMMLHDIVSFGGVLDII